MAKEIQMRDLNREEIIIVSGAGTLYNSPTSSGKPMFEVWEALIAD